jgi:hypothetical protein
MEMMLYVFGKRGKRKEKKGEWGGTGKPMELFLMSDLVSSGYPCW